MAPVRCFLFPTHKCITYLARCQTKNVKYSQLCSASVRKMLNRARFAFAGWLLRAIRHLLDLCVCIDWHSVTAYVRQRRDCQSRRLAFFDRFADRFELGFFRIVSIFPLGGPWTVPSGNARARKKWPFFRFRFDFSEKRCTLNSFEHFGA